MDFLRIGLIGCGKMMGAHVRGVQMVKNAQITCVCDINRENAQRVSQELPNHPKVYTDYKEIVDEVDAVMIALPHDLHYECGMFFALRDKHIMMEKPLCNTEEECLSLIETCEARDLTLMCAYPVPFWTGIEKLKALVDSGEYGKIMQMSVWTEQLTVCDINERPWAASARIGGGQLFSHGCHYIDLMLRFLGNPVEGAHVGTRVGTPWLLKEGTSAVILRFESGAIGYHGATWGARGTRLGYDFQIQCEKGMLEYEHMDGEVRVYNENGTHQPGYIEGNKNRRYSIVWKREEEMGKMTQHEIAHFTDCVLNHKKPMTDGRSALRSLRVIWELYNAEKNHKLADLRGI
ncbi:MAG: Gfo/Idh/MocA family oxidoreductase [Clostridia bacterium]|nr:Gfo/Idh/MocA family oxidoreductase [Clostridia bacterium]